jgi:hypothetical protein|nr:MAG TPA: hypothetical protein [Bacteriophage sp.]DAI57867.1 MAG TPA: hypothetical protein [Caudoviricetes sp.]
MIIVNVQKEVIEKRKLMIQVHIIIEDDKLMIIQVAGQD